MQDAGCWMQDAEYGIPNAESEIQNRAASSRQTHKSPDNIPQTTMAGGGKCQMPNASSTPIPGEFWGDPQLEKGVRRVCACSANTHNALLMLISIYVSVPQAPSAARTQPAPVICPLSLPIPANKYN